jgi:hypothetical protein
VDTATSNIETPNYALSGLSLVSVGDSIRSEQLPSYGEAVAAGAKPNEEVVANESLR